MDMAAPRIPGYILEGGRSAGRSTGLPGPRAVLRGGLSGVAIEYGRDRVTARQVRTGSADGGPGTT